jgi:lysozyme
MKLSVNGFEQLKRREGFDPVARFDRAAWTIGHGNTYYPGGAKVKAGERITATAAASLLRVVVLDFESGVNNAVKATINQKQYDALVSFAYNVGNTAFKRSTLLKKVNANPNDPAIKTEFLRWVNSEGKVIQGLKNRRNEEIKQYFSGTNPALASNYNLPVLAGLGIFIFTKINK